MKDFNRRLNRLEGEHGKPDELPYLSLQEDLDDPGIYRNDRKGITVRRDSDEFEALAATHNLIILSWAESWPPGKEPEGWEPPPYDPDVTVITWGDDYNIPSDDEGRIRWAEDVLGNAQKEDEN